MDMRTENSKDIAIFSLYSMKSLKKSVERRDTNSTKEPMSAYEGGAIHKAIHMVFWDDYCKDHVFGCTFHFMNEMHKRKHDVAEDLRETCIELCEKYVKEVANVTKYSILKGRIDEIAKKYPTISRSID